MKYAVFAAVLGLAGHATGAAQDQAPIGTTGSPPEASATINDADGRAVGEARLQQTPHGVLMRLDLTNATPGVHALHIHDTGRCAPPTFESAGGHFNPLGREHGFLSERGPHMGDLPNIHVPNSRRLTLEMVIDGATLELGERSLLDGDGSAIVMHADPDDYRTDPAGDAGTRLACGVIAP